MNIKIVHAANVANRLFKAYVGTADKSIQPKTHHLTTAIRDLGLAFEQFFIPVPDGGEWPTDDQGQAIHISQNAFDALERDTLLVVENMDALFEGDKPTDLFLAELDKVVANNTRDAKGHQHLDKLYIPLLNDDTSVDEKYTAFLGNELGLSIGRFYNFVPRSSRQTVMQAQENSSPNLFNGKLSFTSNDVELLTEVELHELPDCNDSDEIDHAGNIADLVKIRQAKEHVIQLDTVELEHATIYQRRFKAWMSYVDALGDTRHEAITFAVNRVREAALWAQQQAEERNKNRARNVFKDLAI